MCSDRSNVNVLRSLYCCLTQHYFALDCSRFRGPHTCVRADAHAYLTRREGCWGGPPEVKRSCESHARTFTQGDPMCWGCLRVCWVAWPALREALERCQDECPFALSDQRVWCVRMLEFEEFFGFRYSDFSHAERSVHLCRGL